MKMGEPDIEQFEETSGQINSNTKCNSKQVVEKPNERPEWLPDGWGVDVRIRKSGAHIGSEYKCYIDPLNGYKFYSKPEVLRYLETVKDNSCPSRKEKKSTTQHSPSNVVIETSTADDLPPGLIREVKIRKSGNRIRKDLSSPASKRQKLKQSATKQQPFADDVKEKERSVNMMENANEKNHSNSKFSQNKKEFNVRPRFSRRLAGIEPVQLADNLINEQTFQAPKRNSRKCGTTLDTNMENKSCKSSYPQTGESSSSSVSSSAPAVCAFIPPPPPSMSSPSSPSMSHGSVAPSSNPISTLGSSIGMSGVKTGSSCNRPELEVINDGFLPSHLAANAISDMFRGYYVHPWPSWKQIPKEKRNIWFEDFECKFTFTGGDESTIRKNFEKRGAVVLKNNLDKVRKRMRRPYWIREDVWQGLVTHWQSEGFKKKSAIAKANRASKEGGPTHTGGSISISQHRHNMMKELGHPPSLLDLFRRTHQHKDQSWVNHRAENIMEKFNNEMTQRSQNALIGTPPPSELDVWKDVAGINKGHIYGLGSESAILNPRLRYRGSSSTSSRLEQELENERQTLQARADLVKAELEQLRKQIEENQSRFQENQGCFEEQKRQLKLMIDHIKNMNPDLDLSFLTQLQPSKQRHEYQDQQDETQSSQD